MATKKYKWITSRSTTITPLLSNTCGVLTNILDACLSNAFRNTNNPILWNTANYYFGKTALPVKGFINTLYIGFYSYTQTEDFYRYDAHFKECLRIALDITHAYNNKLLIIGAYEN